MEEDRTALMSARALSPGYEILWYTIKSVLGQGGFGITYLAHDRNLDRTVAIKEYLPVSFAYRKQDFSVKPITGDHRENFSWGLSSFLKEAQTLAKFGHENIVRVHSVFEQNNTAYMVMEYEQGENLASIYKNKTQLDQSFFEGVFFPIFDGLKQIHAMGFIHRDIKPANIYVRNDKTPVLIDFGSARQTSQQQTGEMTTLVSQGYTPLEQYSPNYGEQGPWTDIYALAATLYQGIGGKKPEDSLSRSACLLRSRPDLFEPLSNRTYAQFSQSFLDAIHAGLALQPENRPQNLDTWREFFIHGQSADTFPTRPIHESAIEGTERTRIRPPVRPLSENYQSSARVDDGYPQPSSSVREPSGNRTGRRANKLLDTSVLAGEDKFDFSMDQSSAKSARAGYSEKSKPPATRRKRGWFKPAIAVTLIAVLGGTGYVYLSRENVSKAILFDAKTLANLPQPAAAISTVLPKEHVLKQLDDLAVLASFYANANALQANNTDVITGINRTYNELAVLAKSWNSTNHEKVVQGIIRVADALPAVSNQRERIAGIIAATEQQSNVQAVLNLIKDKQIVDPAGASVLDKVTGLSKVDFDQVSKTDLWLQMMAELQQAALAKLSSADFDGGARIVEVALAIQPNDANMQKLRKHLALR